MSVKSQWHISGISPFFIKITDNVWPKYINWLSANVSIDYQTTINQPSTEMSTSMPTTILTTILTPSTYNRNDLIFLQEKFWLSSGIGGGPSWSDCEMFIIFCTVTAKPEKTIPWDSQAQRKDHNWHKTICFRRNSSFFWIWCTLSSLVQMTNYRDTPKHTILATLCQKQVKFCILLSPSLTQSHTFVTLWLHLLKVTVAIKREKFSHNPILL